MHSRSSYIFINEIYKDSRQAISQTKFSLQTLIVTYIGGRNTALPQHSAKWWKKPTRLNLAARPQPTRAKGKH